MNVLALLKALTTRSALLEEEAQLLREDAAKLLAIFQGDTETEEDDATIVPSEPAPPAKRMPGRDEIRAKAAQYGVDVDDILPMGRKPTLQAKQDALRRILTAKKQTELAAATPIDPPIDI